MSNRYNWSLLSWNSTGKIGCIGRHLAENPDVEVTMSFGPMPPDFPGGIPALHCVRPRNAIAKISRSPSLQFEFGGTDPSLESKLCQLSCATWDVHLLICRTTMRRPHGRVHGQIMAKSCITMLYRSMDYGSPRLG